MNSLETLNQFSNTSVSYGDERPYSIAFSANAASNVTIFVSSVVSSQTVSIPTGIDITEVVSQPGNITYNINANANANIANISWPTLPNYITDTNPGNGRGQITGLFPVENWNQAKYANLNLTGVQSNSFTFTSNISYPNTSNVSITDVKSWTTSVVPVIAGNVTLTAPLGSWPNEAILVMYPNEAGPGPTNVEGNVIADTSFLKFTISPDSNATYEMTLTQNTSTSLPGKWYSSTSANQDYIWSTPTTPGTGNSITLTGNTSVLNNWTWLWFVPTNTGGNVANISANVNVSQISGTDKLPVVVNHPITLEISTKGYPAYTTYWSAYNYKNQPIDAVGYAFLPLGSSDYLGPSIIDNSDYANVELDFSYNMGKLPGGFSPGGNTFGINQYQITFTNNGQGSFWNYSNNASMGQSITSAVFSGNADGTSGLWGNVNPHWVADGYPTPNNTANANISITLTNITANTVILNSIPITISNIGNGIIGG